MLLKNIFIISILCFTLNLYADDFKIYSPKLNENNSIYFTENDNVSQINSYITLLAEINDSVIKNETEIKWYIQNFFDETEQKTVEINNITSKISKNNILLPVQYQNNSYSYKITSPHSYTNLFSYKSGYTKIYAEIGKYKSNVIIVKWKNKYLKNNFNMTLSNNGLFDANDKKDFELTCHIKLLSEKECSDIIAIILPEKWGLQYQENSKDYEKNFEFFVIEKNTMVTGIRKMDFFNGVISGSRKYIAVKSDFKNGENYFFKIKVRPETDILKDGIFKVSAALLENKIMIENPFTYLPKMKNDREYYFSDINAELTVDKVNAGKIRYKLLFNNNGKGLIKITNLAIKSNSNFQIEFEKQINTPLDVENISEFYFWVEIGNKNLIATDVSISFETSKKINEDYVYVLTDTVNLKSDYKIEFEK